MKNWIRDILLVGAGFAAGAYFMHVRMRGEYQKFADTMALYNTCKRMIERGQTAGMAKKLDIFYAANKLTDEQYAELTEMLNEKDSAEKADQ